MRVAEVAVHALPYDTVSPASTTLICAMRVFRLSAGRKVPGNGVSGPGSMP